MAVVIMMILIAAVTLVDFVIFMAVVESHFDDCIIWIMSYRFHCIDFIVLIPLCRFYGVNSTV